MLTCKRINVKNSVAECKTVDEQKQVILIATPVMTQERFAQLTGLTEGQVRGMIEKGYPPIPSTMSRRISQRYSTNSTARVTGKAKTH